MRDKKMKAVLEAFLRMLSAMNQEVGTMSRAGSFSDVEECTMLVDEIRLICLDGLKTLEALENKLMAAGLKEPPEGK